MSLDDLGQWYYLIYLLPFALSFFMIVASGLGSSHRAGARSGHVNGGSHGAGHSGAHHGSHGAGHAQHGADRAHTDRSAGRSKIAQRDGARTVPHAGDVIGGPHAHPIPSQGRRNGAGDHASDAHGPNAILSFFGVGRAPGILLAQGFGLAWGATGFYTTRMFLDHGVPPIAAALPSMALAALGGIAGIKIVGEMGARLMPTEETFAMSKEDLLGSIGTAVYPVSKTMGRVHVYDSIGTLHVESARLCPDETETILNGEAVLLIDYNETLGCFLVERSPV